MYFPFMLPFKQPEQHCECSLSPYTGIGLLFELPPLLYPSASASGYIISANSHLEDQILNQPNGVMWKLLLFKTMREELVSPWYLGFLQKPLYVNIGDGFLLLIVV